MTEESDRSKCSRRANPGSMEGLIMVKNKTGTIVEISFQQARRLPATGTDRATGRSSDAVRAVPANGRHTADARTARREIFEVGRANNVFAMNQHHRGCDTAHRLDDAADELLRSDKALRDAYRSGDRVSIDAARAALQTAIARYLQADAALYAVP